MSERQCSRSPATNLFEALMSVEDSDLEDAPESVVLSKSQKKRMKRKQKMAENMSAGSEGGDKEKASNHEKASVPEIESVPGPADEESVPEIDESLQRPANEDEQEPVNNDTAIASPIMEGEDEMRTHPDPKMDQLLKDAHLDSGARLEAYLAERNHLLDPELFHERVFDEEEFPIEYSRTPCAWVYDRERVTSAALSTFEKNFLVYGLVFAFLVSLLPFVLGVEWDVLGLYAAVGVWVSWVLLLCVADWTGWECFQGGVVEGWRGVYQMGDGRAMEAN
ncbi:hypothetical protein M409DRAFT_60413 [Zasmidium cellare ATCC 36951]|uniref:Uncharacterized protein n=1 Tax=Zasmidium cellare ATCC 36951 TaxID=1080233 RepID=A0A6A6BZG8_ZASCE|nr:uncharacterized protein M409DRAFT_60413 [Zasmidium cellare ATCC 36951]KAF2160013.1 hypothetical protein M409DRAFT_60413 [Zasmidium cellare ATCC 36951]